MVKVETEILDNRQAKIVATVEDERVQQEMKAAARRISKHANIPGFRKGKAPYEIIVRYYGEAAVLEEAIEDLGQAVYQEALAESGIEPYAPGSLDDLERDPLKMIFTVPLVPEVDLGAYRDVRVPYEEPEIDEEDVDRALQDLRDQQATLDPVERPIEMGDVALLDILGTLVRDDEAEAEVEAVAAEGEDGEEAPTRNDIWLNRAEVRVKIAETATYPVPGFPERVLGMAAGDERAFDISFAEDEDVAEALQGKTLHFEVKCDEVYSYTAPELDDEFAKEVGDFETLEELRDDLREQLKQAAARASRDEYLDRIFDELIDNEVVKLSYPPVMLEEQVHAMIEDFDRDLRQQGLNLEEYQRLQNVTDEQLHADLRPEAERQLKRALILGEVAEAEELTVTEDEIEDEIETTVLPYGSQAALARQLFSSPEARNSIANRVLAQKTLDRLVAIARGEEPPIGEPAAAEEEPGTPQAEIDVQPEESLEAEAEAAEGSTGDEAAPPPDAMAPAAGITDEADQSNTDAEVENLTEPGAPDVDAPQEG